MPLDIQDISIRRAHRDELEIITALAEKIWPETYDRILPAGQVEYMLRMMYRPEVLAAEFDAGVRFELIFEGNNPVGFASYGPCPDRNNAAKLHKIYLLARCHGRGIGSTMLAHALDAARREGFSSLRLNVNRNNSAAIKAYLRNGFVKCDEVEIDIGSGFKMCDYIMEHQL